MPDLDFWEARYWGGFAFLSGRRQSGFGLSPIQYETIITYLNENEIMDSEIREDYSRWIIFLDNEYLKLKSDEQKKKKSTPKTQSPKRK